MAIEIMNASDASGLAFVVRYPKSKYLEEVIANLTTEHAKRVAQGLLGKLIDPSHEEQAVIDSFVRWNEKIINDAKQTKEQRVNQLNRIIQEAQSELKQLNKVR